MRNIDWNAVEEVMEFEKVTPGGYVAKIVGVEDVPGKEYLKMEIDIVEGKFAGYFSALFEDKGFWGLNLYRSYKSNALGFFKSFKNQVEESNPGYVFTNDESTLKEKYIGIIIGEEEYIGNDGNEKVRVYIHSTKPISHIREGKFKVPETKKLDRSDVPSGFSANDNDTPF